MASGNVPILSTRSREFPGPNEFLVPPSRSVTCSVRFASTTKAFPSRCYHLVLDLVSKYPSKFACLFNVIVSLLECHRRPYIILLCVPGSNLRPPSLFLGAPRLFLRRCRSLPGKFDSDPHSTPATPLKYESVAQHTRVKV